MNGRRIILRDSRTSARDVLLCTGALLAAAALGAVLGLEIRTRVLEQQRARVAAACATLRGAERACCSADLLREFGH